MPEEEEEEVKELVMSTGLALQLKSVPNFEALRHLFSEKDTVRT